MLPSHDFWHFTVLLQEGFRMQQITENVYNLSPAASLGQ
jgi:hypothetical protein